MKTLIFFIFLLPSILFAGTCSSISRTNNAANSVLTSTKYNSDHNTAYAAINAADGGCITSGTLEKDSLNGTDFLVPLNAIIQGCALTRGGETSITVGKCYTSVNNKWVAVSGNSTVSFGCSGCSAAAASTDYYVYNKTTATSTALDLLISTEVPNSFGLDASSNRVLGRFSTNLSSVVKTGTVYNWHINQIVKPYPVMENYTLTQGGDQFSNLAESVQYNFSNTYVATKNGASLTYANWQSTTDNLIYVVNSGDPTKFYASKACQVTISWSALTNTTATAMAIYKGATVITKGNFSITAPAYSTASASIYLAAGEYFTIGAEAGYNVSNNAGLTYLTFTASLVE